MGPGSYATVHLPPQAVESRYTANKVSPNPVAVAPSAASATGTVEGMTDLSPDYFAKPVADVDPEIADVLRNEVSRAGDARSR